MKVKSSLYALAFIAMSLSCFISVNAQNVAPGYEVAQWHQFKNAAISYTFDDNTPKQLAVAMPLFDKVGFNTTLFPVINWDLNWPGYRDAVGYGHEIGSHTVTHMNLGDATISDETKEAEISRSKSVIDAEITAAKCVTIAYPFCNIGVESALPKYFIAGRVCSGVVETSTPSDFYRISSICCGTQGLNTVSELNEKVASALKNEGWCVLMFHAIDDDNGYSPISSVVLGDHLGFVKSHDKEYWVETFANVVKYIKERNATNVSEKFINKKQIQVSVTDGLDNNVYDRAITIRRELPKGWSNAKVAVGGVEIASTRSIVDHQRFVTFDVIPDRGDVVISKIRE